ncbi:MAG: hypothetical protein M3Q64_03660 [bacterium]|nr:hypothetical protein [bacterium]
METLYLALDELGFEYQIAFDIILNEREYKEQDPSSKTPYLFTMYSFHRDDSDLDDGDDDPVGEITKPRTLMARAARA